MKILNIVPYLRLGMGTCDLAFVIFVGDTFCDAFLAHERVGEGEHR